MWIAVQLAYHHYSPEKLQVGMMFMNHTCIGTDKELIELFILDEDQLTHIEKDDFISSNGYPVEPFILDEFGSVIIHPENIGWFELDAQLELMIIGVKEFNFIMREFDGLLEMFVDEDIYEEGEIEAITEKNRETKQDLAIFRFLRENEDEDITI